MKRMIGLLLAALLIMAVLSGCAPQAANAPDAADAAQTQTLAMDGSYTTKDDVALYLHLYGELPRNFITKAQARALGWDGGGLENIAPGKCIGGDRFGNFEGLLPEVPGRSYFECDINTLGADSRGPERIVYSSDGLIYYTADHYESFTLLYGDDSP
ncbi:MAG TPA: ribonuclease domain-containing protein [Candidatus Limiplasma sp.]|nr:ribonuclease domain-containing protein [Candidatus Limiplasma sp.]HRX08557.1 ribonuclease domain-containing protein [Candidatus Limiplasma sp.]